MSARLCEELRGLVCSDVFSVGFLENMAGSLGGFIKFCLDIVLESMLRKINIKLTCQRRKRLEEINSGNLCSCGLFRYGGLLCGGTWNRRVQHACNFQAGVYD